MRRACHGECGGGRVRDRHEHATDNAQTKTLKTVYLSNSVLNHEATSWLRRSENGRQERNKDTCGYWAARKQETVKRTRNEETKATVLKLSRRKDSRKTASAIDSWVNSLAESKLGISWRLFQTLEMPQARYAVKQRNLCITSVQLQVAESALAQENYLTFWDIENVSECPVKGAGNQSCRGTKESGISQGPVVVENDWGKKLGVAPRSSDLSPT